jgi:hypothetical protein
MTLAGFIVTIGAAPCERVLFDAQHGAVTAGRVRATAADIFGRIERGTGPVFLHTQSAALFTAGLLAAAAARRPIAMPAHLQPGYLDEIGARPEAILTDLGSDDGLRLSEASDRPAFQDVLAAGSADPLLILFTSGSSARPKPIEKHLRQLETEARVLDQTWGRGAGVVRATVSHQHIYGLLYRIIWPVMSGRISADEAAAYWGHLAPELGPDVTLISSPAHLTRLPPGLDLARVAPAQIFSSGQLLTPAAARAAAEAFGKPIIEVLGSTETGGVAWRSQDEPDAPWAPFPDIGLTLDEDGVVHVVSPYLASSAPHPIGDRGEVLADGRLRLLGRADRVEKIDGLRVSLSRVEASLSALPEIDAARVLSLPAKKGALAAVVTLTDAGRAAYRALGAFRLSRRLRAATEATLRPGERPKHWRFVAELPTNSQGKVVLEDLRALFATPPEIDTLSFRCDALGDTEARVSLTVDGGLKWFGGHFPEKAILPGVAQLRIIELLTADLFGFQLAGASLARVKFRQIIRPGHEIVVLLRAHRSARLVDFTIQRPDGSEVAIGRIGGVNA